MIAATASLEFVTTRTETEALLLEANLIKRLRPRFNVLMRDDKSFPYIVISRDHPAPQILKHRGARTRPGDYFGPFASVWAVNRTITALQRAFLIRSCSDAVFESRTRPCLLHQIKRCSAPCTGEIAPDAYAELVREAREFLSGKSHAVKQLLAQEMEKASHALDFERAAIYRDRLAALSAIQSQQGVNLRGVDDADVFAIHQAGGYNCVQVFFFRTGQNWGNRAYFPKADRGLPADEVLNAFIAQFYDDKPCPRTDPGLGRTARARAARRSAVDQERPFRRGEPAEARREARRGRSCARQCARGARAQACGDLVATGAAEIVRGAVRAAGAAAPDRGLRQQPHPGIERGRRAWSSPGRKAS